MRFEVNNDTVDLVDVIAELKGKSASELMAIFVRAVNGRSKGPLNGPWDFVQAMPVLMLVDHEMGLEFFVKLTQYKRSVLPCLMVGEFAKAAYMISPEVTDDALIEMMLNANDIGKRREAWSQLHKYMMNPSIGPIRSLDRELALIKLVEKHRATLSPQP